MKEALLTGATGFIGSHVALALLEAGWRVRCLTRRGPPSDGPLVGREGVEWVQGDLNDARDLRLAARSCAGVFHVAAHYALWSRDPGEFYRVNVEGTRAVLEAARAEGIRAVYTSSVSCVGEAPPGGLADEDTAAHPQDLVGDYKRSKWEGEQVALELAAAGTDVTIVNPASVIGPGDWKPTPTGQILVDFLRGRMPCYVDTGLNFVDVRDVAAGHLLAFEKGRAGRRYILGNKQGNLSLREFLQVAGQVAGRRPPRVRIPWSVAYVAGAVSTFVADHVTHAPPGVPLNGVKMARHRMFFDPSRAVAELGLPQTPLETTVRDAVEWFRARSMV